MCVGILMCKREVDKKRCTFQCAPSYRAGYSHVGTAQGKFVSRRTPQKRVGKLIWRVMRPRDQIEKNYIKFSEVRYSVLSICAARKCPDGMQTWGDVKTESHVFACPRYI